METRQSCFSPLTGIRFGRTIAGKEKAKWE